MVPHQHCQQQRTAAYPSNATTETRKGERVSANRRRQWCLNAATTYTPCGATTVSSVENHNEHKR